MPTFKEIQETITVTKYSQDSGSGLLAPNIFESEADMQECRKFLTALAAALYEKMVHGRRGLIAFFSGNRQETSVFNNKNARVLLACTRQSSSVAVRASGYSLYTAAERLSACEMTIDGVFRSEFGWHVVLWLGAGISTSRYITPPITELGAADTYSALALKTTDAALLAHQITSEPNVFAAMQGH